MIRVMFVCHGNIRRSPMAEFIFKDLVQKQGLADDFMIASSATSTEEIWNGIGNPVYPPAKAELASMDCPAAVNELFGFRKAIMISMIILSEWMALIFVI